MMITDHADLLTEILLWLPAKSLIRFKLVCKDWQSLISGRHFSHQHTLHHRLRRCRHHQPPSLLLHLPESSDYFYLQNKKWEPYDISPSLTEPTILSFSNGLFLLQCGNSKNPMEDCNVYNPATKHARKILLNENDKYGCVMGLNLAFDPAESPHYKIVCVRIIRRRRSSILWRGWWTRCQIEVYDSESCTWKLCGEPFLAPQEAQFDNGIYWKGGIHWRGAFFDFHESAVTRHPGVVVSGDTRMGNISDNYVESNGCLQYVAHFKVEKSVMVFELKGDHSEWSLKYRIDLDWAVGPVSVLSVVRGESGEDSRLVVHEPGKIMAYKVEEKSVDEVIDFRDEAFYKEGCVQFVSLGTFQFTETLAPV